VVDTISFNEKTFVDNYRTPHTDKMHVVERFKLIEEGKVLRDRLTVEDPSAYNMAWSGVQRWRRNDRGPLMEISCAENNYGFLGCEVVPIPEVAKPDF
jgi:hypothetical protein